jgi:hypothetical protein
MSKIPVYCGISVIRIGFEVSNINPLGITHMIHEM